MTPEDIPHMTDAGFTIDNASEPIIKVIGVGGGGNNAVSHMYEQNIKEVSFVILNTDRQALNHSPVPTRVQIGNGLGAGNKPEVARVAAEEAKDKILDLFNDKTKMVFITAGMGGGTGTGAAPVVARLARDRGLLTIGIVTIPFLFEGPKKIAKAITGAEEMAKYVDALLIINNERLNVVYPDLNFVNAFEKADDTLTTAARSISDIITSEGKINLDFNDVDTTLRNGGAAIISTGRGEGENRITKAINDALNSPLLKDRDVLTSKRLLFNLYFNPDAEMPLKAGETEELTSFISGIDPQVEVIWGTAFDRTLGDAVKITILAAGFDLSVDDGRKSEVIRLGEPAPEKSDDPSGDLNKIEKEYGAGAVGRILRERANARAIVISPAQMDDDAFIDALEKSPTFTREKNHSDEIKEIGIGPKKNSGQPAAESRRPTPPPSTGNTIHFG